MKNMKSAENKPGTEPCGLCEVKWPCAFLLDNELALITGVVLPVDGGASIGF